VSLLPHRGQRGPFNVDFRFDSGFVGGQLDTSRAYPEAIPVKLGMPLRLLIVLTHTPDGGQLTYMGDLANAPSVTFIESSSLDELRPVWAGLHRHHLRLESEGQTSALGGLRGLNESWEAQRRMYERALRSPHVFLAVARRDTEAVGYALVVCRPDPVWGVGRTAQIEVLCVRDVDPGLAAGVARGRTLKVLLAASITEAQRRGVTRWAATCLAANTDVRRLAERLGGEQVTVGYQGSVEVAQAALGAGRLGRDTDPSIIIPATQGTFSPRASPQQ
jgi:hypothetical protein